jgi:hypothetical protein
MTALIRGVRRGARLQLCRSVARRVLLGVAVALWLGLAVAAPSPARAQSAAETPVLSAYWEPAIQRRANLISALSEAYGFHPDFIAAVILHESRNHRPISHPAAVGLMNVMAVGPAWRPSSEALLLSAANLRWGMAVLSYVVQQAGGDLFTALAAYKGGWQHVNGRLPREYAAAVLDSYARALLVRGGLSPEAAARWTVAVDIRAGNVPNESLLVLGQTPLAPQAVVARRAAFVRHTVYAFVDAAGHAYHVRGYVVPVGLSELVTAGPDGAAPDELEAPLRARLGEKIAGSAAGNPRVLLACLASLTRLRGQVTTRWYRPSGCPALGR